MNKNVLVIGDTHIPYEHKHYLSFCKRVEKEYKCTQVVHIGDLVDNHALSYKYIADPDGNSPREEIKQAKEHLKEWYIKFPKVMLCRGNHDKRVNLKGKHVGLPDEVFRPFRDIWELPKNWQDGFEWIISNVKYLHGNLLGDMCALKTAFDNRMSCVVGHSHSVSSVHYSANNDSIIWGMAVGCGIDRESFAFAYDTINRRKQILSCGVVSYTDRGVYPTIIPMKL